MTSHKLGTISERLQSRFTPRQFMTLKNGKASVDPCKLIAGAVTGLASSGLGLGVEFGDSRGAKHSWYDFQG
jgi:hypothetical protein